MKLLKSALGRAKKLVRSRIAIAFVLIELACAPAAWWLYRQGQGTSRATISESGGDPSTIAACVGDEGMRRVAELSRQGTLWSNAPRVERRKGNVSYSTSWSRTEDGRVKVTTVGLSEGQAFIMTTTLTEGQLAGLSP